MTEGCPLTRAARTRAAPWPDPDNPDGPSLLLLCATLKAVGAPQGADPKESIVTLKYHEVPVRFHVNLTAGQLAMICHILGVAEAGYELKDYELRWIANFRSSSMMFLEAQGATLPQVRTGYRTAQARLGADDTDGHCVCGEHEPDD